MLWSMLGHPKFPRVPKFAGFLYPAARDELAASIREALGDGPADARAIIVPHSELALVAELVGAGFSRLAPARRVVIVGPSHKIPFAGIAVPNADGWTTPLATSRIDLRAYDALEPLGVVRVLDAVFDAEPAVELLVLWVQTTHPRARMVGMLGGDLRPDDAYRVLDALADDDTVFVVACELARDRGERDVVRADEATLDAIGRLESDELSTDDLTARGAVGGLLRLARERGWGAHTILHRTSRELGARDELVAGFAAVAFVPGQP